jgi:hypothetical protein
MDELMARTAAAPAVAVAVTGGVGRTQRRQPTGIGTSDDRPTEM